MNANSMYLFELEALVEEIKDNPQFLPDIQSYLSRIPQVQCQVAVTSKAFVPYAEQLGFNTTQIVLLESAHALSTYVQSQPQREWYLFLHRYDNVEINHNTVYAVTIIVDKNDNLLPEKDRCYINAYCEADYLF